MKTQRYIVTIRLVGNRNPCHIGHKIGDEWVFDYRTPEGMCSLAFNAMYPVLMGFRYGATFPWQDEPDVVTMACPDAGVNNVFELRRRPKE